MAETSLRFLIEEVAERKQKGWAVTRDWRYVVGSSVCLSVGVKVVVLVR